MSGFMSFVKHGGRRRASSEDGFELVTNLAKQYNMSIEDVRRKRQEFLECDSSNNGVLTHAEFIEALRKRCNVPADEPIPEDLLNSKLSKALSKADGKGLNFEEFLLWSSNTEYAEAMLVTDPEERHLRQLARENGIRLPDVERIKANFEAFDTDRSGLIDEEEFRQILLKLMRIKNPADISAQKFRRYWREVDCDLSGSVNFDEFLLWYINFFDT